MLLLSRFWYLVLAVVAAGALAAALLAQGIVNRLTDSQIAAQLRRDRVELDAMLSLEARRRLDRIAFITVDPKIGGILRKASAISDPKRLFKLNTELKETLNEHFKQMAEAAPGGGTPKEKLARVKPTIAFALDARGRIIAQTGPLTANPPGARLETFPLVKRALQGYVRDDVWVYDRRVYRMAARPVINGGQYVGAIVHGYKPDEPFVEKLSKSLGGAGVTFFYGTEVLASYSPADLENAPSREQMAAWLQNALDDKKFKKGEMTDPVELQGDNLAVYSLLKGSAAEAQVGYVIARPRRLLASPQEFFDSATEDDVARLPLLYLIGGAIGLFLLGVLWIFLERDWPFRHLISRTEEIVRDERDRLIITEWRGSYRRLADYINQAIDREVEKAAEMAPSSRKKVDLDEILGPTPEAASADAFFGFAGDAARTPADQIPAPPPADNDSAQKAPAGSAKEAPKIPPPPAGPPDSRASPPPAAPASPIPPPNAASFDEQAHFKEVFEQYLTTRGQCGESTEGLSFEKFLVTLRKNRDQIISRHDAKAVRFTVYVKNGKAALKASPIKK